MKDCIFCKIREGKIAKEFIYQDKDVMVFTDINPIKPVHLLIIPKKHIEDFLDLDDANLGNKLKNVIKKMIKSTAPQWPSRRPRATGTRPRCGRPRG